MTPREVEWLHQITQSLRRIEKALGIIQKEEGIQLVDLTKLQADVEAENTVLTSAETLLAGLAEAVRAIPAPDTNTQAAVDALATEIEGKTAELSAAIAANTVTPAPAPTPAAPPVEG